MEKQSPERPEDEPGDGATDRNQEPLAKRLRRGVVADECDQACDQRQSDRDGHEATSPENQLIAKRGPLGTNNRDVLETNSRSEEKKDK